MSQPLFDKKNDWEEFSNVISDKNVEQEADRIGSKPGTPVKETVIRFDIKPEELESYLNKYIIGQENAVEIIATKVCTHFNRMEIERTIPDDEKVVGNIKSTRGSWEICGPSTPCNIRIPRGINCNTKAFIIMISPNKG